MIQIYLLGSWIHGGMVTENAGLEAFGYVCVGMCAIILKMWG